MNNTTIATITTFNNEFIELYHLDVFHKAIQSFRAKANLSGLTSSEHILYNLVRNLPLKRGFSPITNKIKLANGHHEEGAFNRAYSNLSYDLKYSKSNEMLKKFNLPEESKEYFIKLMK